MKEGVTLSTLPYTIDDLRKACNDDNIKWSLHALKRLRERQIKPADFINCIITGEIIEYYPEDYRTPSCLVSGISRAALPLHTVSGYDGEYLYAVTAYYPNTSEWESDYKTRKVKL